MLLMTSTQWAAARFFSLWLGPASPLSLPPSASSSIPRSLPPTLALCVGCDSINSICSVHHAIYREKKDAQFSVGAAVCISVSVLAYQIECGFFCALACSLYILPTFRCAGLTGLVKGEMVVGVERVKNSERGGE